MTEGEPLGSPENSWFDAPTWAFRYASLRFLASDKAGNLYASSLEYNSPIRMMVTRCDKVGSVEATEFTFSDELPVAGQVIAVQAAIENVGLTDAKGYEIQFFECKDGVKGKQIGKTYTSWSWPSAIPRSAFPS